MKYEAPPQQPVILEQNSWQYLGIAKDLVGKIPSNFDDALTDEELPGFGLLKFNYTR